MAWSLRFRIGCAVGQLGAPGLDARRALAGGDGERRVDGGQRALGAGLLGRLRSGHQIVLDCPARRIRRRPSHDAAVHHRAEGVDVGPWAKPAAGGSIVPKAEKPAVAVERAKVRLAVAERLSGAAKGLLASTEVEHTGDPSVRRTMAPGRMS